MSVEEVAAAEARVQDLEDEVATVKAASLEAAQRHADEIAALVRTSGPLHCLVLPAGLLA